MRDAPCRFDVVEAEWRSRPHRACTWLRDAFRAGRLLTSAPRPASRVMTPARLPAASNWPTCSATACAATPASALGLRLRQLAARGAARRRRPAARRASRCWRWCAPAAATACRWSRAAAAPTPPARRCRWRAAWWCRSSAWTASSTSAPGDRCAVVEPGVLNGDLQPALAPHGLFWPPDPTSAAFSTRRRQPRLQCRRPARGEVRRQPRQRAGADRGHRRRRADYAAAPRRRRARPATTCTRLLVGTEGTLALIVEATLRLTPAPRARRALRALYRDVASAAQRGGAADGAAGDALDAGVHGRPLRCGWRAMSAAPTCRRAGALLMIEADGDRRPAAATTSRP